MKIRHHLPSFKSCLLIALVISSIDASSQERVTVNGVILDNKSNSIPHASVVNKTASKEGNTVATSSNAEGKFTIAVAKGDILHVAAVGYRNAEITINEIKDLRITLPEFFDLTDVIVTAAASPRSTWVGAKIGYNFDGITEDNSFIGAAKISINPLKSKFSDSKNCPYISIIGNFADFISNANRDSVKTKINSLTQSVQGLSIGLGSTWEYPFDIGGDRDNRMFFRPYITSNYRLNTFTKVGPDSSTVNLSQFRNTIGVELEGLTFVNGGPINISFEASISTFGASRYEKVFGERKSSISSLEGTVILPISKQIGFFVNGTFTKETKPIFLSGVIVKSN